MDNYPDSKKKFKHYLGTFILAMILSTLTEIAFFAISLMPFMPYELFTRARAKGINQFHDQGHLVLSSFLGAYLLSYGIYLLSTLIYLFAFMVGKRIHKLLLCFAGCTALLSIFLSNLRTHGGWLTINYGAELGRYVFLSSLQIALFALIPLWVEKKHFKYEKTAILGSWLLTTVLGFGICWLIWPLL